LQNLGVTQRKTGFAYQDKTGSTFSLANDIVGLRENLRQAVKDKNLEKVKEILKTGKLKDLDIDDKYGKRPSFFANNDIRVIEALVQAGADVNDSHFFYNAFLNQNLSQIEAKELLNNLVRLIGSQLDMKRFKESSPLSKAIISRYFYSIDIVNIVRDLLSYGADPNIEDLAFGLPLCSIIDLYLLKKIRKQELKAVIKTLLEAGANPDLKCNFKSIILKERDKGTDLSAMDLVKRLPDSNDKDKKFKDKILKLLNKHGGVKSSKAI